MIADPESTTDLLLLHCASHHHHVCDYYIFLCFASLFRFFVIIRIFLPFIFLPFNYNIIFSPVRSYFPPFELGLYIYIYIFLSVSFFRSYGSFFVFWYFFPSLVFHLLLLSSRELSNNRQTALFAFGSLKFGALSVTTISWGKTQTTTNPFG